VDRERVVQAGDSEERNASSLEVLLVFLRLGCTSFGGPIAHLGYFRKELVERRRWCSDAAFAETVGLAQSLPGPSSSQVGFALGLMRAGWPGGVAAWVGFTLPSALLMMAFALGHAQMKDGAAARVLHGLQLVAVAVVAQAVVTMWRSLAPDATRSLIALAGGAIVLSVRVGAPNLLAIGLGVVAGLILCGDTVAVPMEEGRFRLGRPQGIAAGAGFVGLLGLTWFVGPLWLQIFAAFYRRGALVFGGGHVVLPLLEHTVVDRGWVGQQAFLSGYGVVQAMPGPLFSFGGYLGALVPPYEHRWVHAGVALVGLFLPGLLLMAAVVPFWSALRRRPRLQAALRGVNASVVGILAAALVHPLIPSTVHGWVDAVVALAAFVVLSLRRVQPWMVVVGVGAVFLLW
jgi:chromate transporter